MISITGLLATLGDFIRSNIFVGLASGAGTLLAFYRYVYKSPELYLELDIDNIFDPDRMSDKNDQNHVAEIFGDLKVINGGNKYAEDVQLSLTADAFTFSNDIPDMHSTSEGYDIPSGLPAVKYGRKQYFIGGGERNDIILDNTVYEKDIQQFSLGRLKLPEGKSILYYTISCKGHGARNGKPVFHAYSGWAVVVNCYPTYWRLFKIALGFSPTSRRKKRVDNADLNVNIDISLNSQNNSDKSDNSSDLPDYSYFKYK